MKIVFSRTLLKKEQVGVSEKILLVKALAKGVFRVIKGESLPKNSQLIKLYMTTIAGARRAVFLVDMKTSDIFFLFYRSKNDPIGQNITIKNQLFLNTLKKYLGILNADLINNHFEVMMVTERI